MLLAHAAEAHFLSLEHVHAMINHLPVIGLAMAILALALALKHHSRKTKMIALILVLIAAASAWPVVYTGQRAYKTVRGIMDSDGTIWLDEHMERAERVAPAFYLLALLTTAALIAPHNWPRTTRPLPWPPSRLRCSAKARAAGSRSPAGKSVTRNSAMNRFRLNPPNIIPTERIS